MGPYPIIPGKYPGLVDAVARGASRFENLLAPQKTYWLLPQNKTCAMK